MLSVLEAKYNGNKYPIYISDNAVRQLDLYLKDKNKKVIIICDECFKKKSLHIDDNFSKILKKYKVFYFKSGIKNKNFNYVSKIINFFFKNNISRDYFVVSIGGGVVGDISSFAASIYHRGLNLIHMPTSMTSMIDSAIGGKTGFNHFGVVNLCGTYYHPKATFIDLRFLSTLSERDYLSGISEIIKKAIIFDNDLFNFLKKNRIKILSKDIKSVSEILFKSIRIKLIITTSDEKENNQRLLLNYGHTFGQAIEAYFGINQKILTHGEAVSLGIVAASKLSDLKFDLNTLDTNRNLLKQYKLPTNFSDLNIRKQINLNKLIGNLKNDKKKTIQGIRFIISKKIGVGEVIFENNTSNIRKSFKEILK